MDHEAMAEISLPHEWAQRAHAAADAYGVSVEVFLEAAVRGLLSAPGARERVLEFEQSAGETPAPPEAAPVSPVDRSPTPRWGGAP